LEPLGKRVGWSDRLLPTFLMKLIRSFTSLSAFALVISAVAAPVTFPPNAKGLHLETVVGSFKIKKGSDAPDTGVLDINFTGTVLISNLKGVATPSAGVRLDYNRPDMEKQVFHGTGSLHIAGQFGGILFFGRDMHALYDGTGVIQLFGEFDKSLNTGWYWYGNDPKTKSYWGTFGATILPQRQIFNTTPSKIKIKDVGAKG
jgi:hypothetical protein